MARKALNTKSLRALNDGLGIVLEDRELPWKYYIIVYRKPKKVAKELRKIAN